MIIRKAKLGDCKEFIRLFNLFRKDDEDAFLSGFLLEAVRLKKNYKKEVERYFKSFISSTKKAIYFAEEEKEIIGLVFGSISTHGRYYEHYDKEGVIDGIFVIRSKRGKGISSKLKDELFKWFKSKKLKFVGLGVMDKNKKAQKIYKKWGFKPFWNKMELKL
ncbi:GNAT family N-acetyltransferase [Nanoarchaeota archaeon]